MGSLLALRRLALLLVFGGVGLFVGGRELLTYARNPAPIEVTCAALLDGTATGWFDVRGCQLELGSAWVRSSYTSGIQRVAVAAHPAGEAPDPDAPPRLIVLTDDPAHLAPVRRVGELDQALHGARAMEELRARDPKFAQFMADKPMTSAATAAADLARYLAEHAAELRPRGDLEGWVVAIDDLPRDDEASARRFGAPNARALRLHRSPRLAWPIALAALGALSLLVALGRGARAALGRGAAVSQ